MSLVDKIKLYELSNLWVYKHDDIFINSDFIELSKGNFCLPFGTGSTAVFKYIEHRQR